MSLYRHKVTGDVKDLDPAQIQAWIDAGNQKGAHYRDEWEPYTSPVLPLPVPSEVTRRQLFLWLNSIGITRAQVRGMITTEAALIEFDEATTFARSHTLVVQLATALGMTAEQVDDAFRAASAL